MYYRTEGIITHTRNYSESDKIIKILSKDKGMISAIAKGSRKTKSKLAGRIDIFCKNSFYLSKGKSLDLVSQADIVSNYYQLRSDYEKVTNASYVLSIINKYVLAGLEHFSMFMLVDQTLQLLTESDNYDKIIRMFQTKFLEIEGIANGDDHNNKKFEAILKNYYG